MLVKLVSSLCCLEQLCLSVGGHASSWCVKTDVPTLSVYMNGLLLELHALLCSSAANVDPAYVGQDVYVVC